MREKPGEMVQHHECPRCRRGRVPNFLLVCKRCWGEMPRSERMMAYTKDGKRDLLRRWAEEHRSE